MKKESVLVLSGHDPANMAGYGRDLSVFFDLGLHPVGSITALTSQIPGLFDGVLPVSGSFLRKQLKCIKSFFSFNSVKIGMVYNKEICQVLESFLKDFKGPIVLDPVLNATAGPALLKGEALTFFKNKIIPLATLITPNMLEAQKLIKKELELPKDICSEWYKLFKTPILLKGGHGHDLRYVKDIYFDGDRFFEWKRKKFFKVNTHGSGCLISSAITAFLAKGYSIIDAVEKGEKYLTEKFNSPMSLQKKKYL